MYESFFGLKLRPFKIAPDPDFLFWTPAHRNAATILAIGVEQLAPISVMTGDVGTGKTTLLRQFLDDAPGDMTVGLISNFWSGSGELYRWLLNAFDIRTDGNLVALFRAFEDFVISEYAAGRRTVVIVDEAQNLSDPDLEQLRMLTNINSGKDCLLMLVFVGQPQLRDRLRQRNNRQIAQRVGTTFHLPPMSPDETRGYVRHRISIAGGDREIFDEAAIDQLHRISGGVPRLVNSVAELAMVTAFGDGVDRIDGPYFTEFLEEARGSGLLGHVTGNDDGRDPKEDIAPPPGAMPLAAGVRPGSGSGMLRVVAQSPFGCTSGAGSARAAAGSAAAWSEPDAPFEFGAGATPLARAELETDGSFAVRPAMRQHPGDREQRGGDEDRKRIAGVTALPERLDAAVPSARLARPAIVAPIAAALAGLAVFLAWPRQDVADLAPPHTGPESAALTTTSLVEPTTPVPARSIARLDDPDAATLMERALSAGNNAPEATAVLFARAALRGHARAASYLAQLYEAGDGVPRDLALARAWYLCAAGEIRLAERRLIDLDPPERTGALEAPRPILGGPTESGRAEFVWTSGRGADPAYFLVEIAAGPLAPVTRFGPQQTSALMIDDISDASLWRVVAVDPDTMRYAVSDWRPMGRAPESLTLGRTPVLSQITIASRDPTGASEIEAKLSGLPLGPLTYRPELAEKLSGNDGQVRYFFDADSDLAGTIANSIPGAVPVLQEASQRDAAPQPGQIDVILASTSG